MKKNVNVNSENNGAINAAKVSNVDYKFYKVGMQGFLNECGTVVRVTVVSVTVDLRNCTTTSTLSDANGKTYVRQGEYMLYATLQDYENGKKMNRFIFHTPELLRKADGDYTKNCKTYVIDEATNEETGETTSNVYMEVWTFVDGDAVPVPAVVDDVTCTVNGWSMYGGKLPEKYWPTKAETLKWNEYRIIDEDGDEFTERSADLRLAPTAEQQTILDEMKAVFQKAMDANLLIVHNNGELMAINMDEVVPAWNDEKHADHELCGSHVHACEVSKTSVGVKVVVSTLFELQLIPTPRQLKRYKKEHPDAQC